LTDFGTFLNDFGDLHDCTVTQFAWNGAKRTATFEIEDVWWNFEGLPEYGGPIPGTIVLEDVQKIEVEFREGGEFLIISEFTLVPHDSDSSTATVWFRGNGKIVADFGRVSFPEVARPARPS
jgi:hypothetical protein